MSEGKKQTLDDKLDRKELKGEVKKFTAKRHPRLWEIELTEQQRENLQ